MIDSLDADREPRASAATDDTCSMLIAIDDRRDINNGLGWKNAGCVVFRVRRHHFAGLFASTLVRPLRNCSCALYGFGTDLGEPANAETANVTEIREPVVGLYI